MKIFSKIMLVSIFILIAVFCFIQKETYSQTVSTTIMLNKDADIFSLRSLVDKNYGTHPLLKASKWTSGVPYTRRGLLEFDLSTISEGSIIKSATLTLFGQNHQQNNSNTRSNASYLLKVIKPWKEQTVTWKTQPKITTSGQVITIPETGVGNANRQIDIKTFVQDWVDGEENNGMMMQLVNEVHYSAMSFASSDNANTSLCPKLDITYILPLLIVNTKNLKISNENGNALRYSISGSGLSSNHVAVGSTIEYKPSIPLEGATETEVLVAFKFDNNTNSSTVTISINKDSYITGVKASDGSDLASSYYKIINNTTIVFLDGTSLYEEENILPVYVYLKDGILMDLDDPLYNKFRVIVPRECRGFSLTIFDKMGVKVFNTTDKEEQWDGKTTVFNALPEDPPLYVFPGSYSYEIRVEETLVKGKFLIEYTIQ